MSKSNNEGGPLEICFKISAIKQRRGDYKVKYDTGSKGFLGDKVDAVRISIN